MGNDEIDVLSHLLSTISGLLVLLLAVFGWIGNRVHNRLDEIATSLKAIESDLREDLSQLDRRVSRIETVSEMANIIKHPSSGQNTNRQRSRKTDFSS